MHRNEYQHLVESAEKEIKMCKECIEHVEHAPGHCICPCGLDDFAQHQEEVTFFVSPWVRRNEDFAQYSKPRGSEYEG